MGSSDLRFPLPDYRGPVLPHGEIGDEPVRGGVDLPAPRGTPVRALRDGRVVEAGWDEYGGYTVLLLDREGLRYYYAHFLKPPLVRAGDVIQAGDVLGYVGTTGNAEGTPPHLHLGVGPEILPGQDDAGGTGGNSFDAVALLRAALGYDDADTD